jgi:hypothetical protein
LHIAGCIEPGETSISGLSQVSAFTGSIGEAAIATPLRRD